MPRAILTSRMPPGSRDEEVRVDSFVEQCVDYVRPWSEFKQRLREFQPDASVLVAILRVSHQFADSRAESQARGPGDFDSGQEQGAEVESVV